MTSEEPTRVTPPSSRVPATVKPVLASDALREEIAPVEPGRVAARWWCLVVAAVLALPLGVQLLIAGPSDVLWHGALAVAALLAAALPLPYGLRALSMVLVALVAAGAGLIARGPMAPFARGVGQWALPALLAAAVLGGALLFRARYRAYARARSITAAALALALPYAAYCALSVARGPLSLQVASSIVLVVIAAGTLGMMGSEVAVAGDWIAAALILSSTAQIAVSSFTPQGWQAAQGAELAPALGALAAYAASCVLGAVGLFQLLSWRHWRSARRVDVHAPAEEDKDERLSEPGW